MKILYDHQLIKATFDKSGLSPTQLAAKAGLSVQTIYQVFNGEDVRYSTLLKVVLALGLSMGVVCGVAKEVA